MLTLLPDYFHQVISRTGRSIVLLTCLCVSDVSLAHEATVQSLPNQQVLVSVNQSPITQKALDDAIALALLNGRQEDTSNLHSSVLDELIVTEAMYQAAQKAQLSQKDDVQRALMAMQKKLLAEAWLAEALSKQPITDAQIKAEYDRQVQLAKSGRNANEYKVLHIVTSDEGQAQQIIKRLKAGESFDGLAKIYSLDKHSSAKGGQLNWMMPDQFIPPLGDILVTLPKGQLYPQPIKTAIGWHVIKLEGLREVTIPELELIKSALLRNMVEERKGQLIDQLMKQTRVEPTP